MMDATDRFRERLLAGDVDGAVGVARAAGLRPRREDFPALAERDQLHRNPLALGVYENLHVHRIRQEEAALAALSPPAGPAPGESLTPYADRAAALSNPAERAVFEQAYRVELQGEADHAAKYRASRLAELDRETEEHRIAWHATQDPDARRSIGARMVAIETERASLAT